MHENIIKNVLYFAAFIIANCVAMDEYVLDQSYYSTLGLTGQKPEFSRKTYTANIDGISLELETPIILDNCRSVDTYFEIDMSHTDYVTVRGDKSPAIGENCTLMFPKVFIKNKSFADEAFAGFITVKVLHQKYVLDVTSVVLLPRTNTKEIKLIFEVDGTEYIILNYYYLKVTFISILVITALILIVEIKEIHDKYTRNKYTTLETSI